MKSETFTEDEVCIQELVKLGKRLRKLRIQRGMTQLDLEIAAKVYRPDISKIERGLLFIEFRTIVKLAIGLEKTVSDFFVEELPGEKEPMGKSAGKPAGKAKSVGKAKSKIASKPVAKTKGKPAAKPTIKKVVKSSFSPKLKAKGKSKGK